MKTVKLLAILMILSISLNAQTYSEKRFYYGFSEKIEINQVKNKILVKTKQGLSKTQYKQLVKKHVGDIKTEWQNENLCKIELINSEKSNEKIKKLLTDNEVVSVKPYYKTNNGLEFGLSDEIIVKFKQNIKDSEKEKVLKKFNLQRAQSTKIYDRYHLAKDKDIIVVANELYESGLFEFACPNIICKAELFEIPNDPYFQSQVALHNTGQTFNGHTGTSNADIDAPEAWDITHGSSNIIIAVLDEGVTSNHPDLPNTRQVRLNGSNFGLGNSNDPSPVGNSNHGNACAGIIAATMNNNEGIAGIAPNCKIMPLRWDETTTPDTMADAIEFAVDNGANIISNSWGYENSSGQLNLFPVIVTAIQYAIDNGVVVVFAAGNTASHANNNNGYVTFPANANVNYLLTIGASDRYDKMADYSPTSSLIDIVAPSHRAYPSSISGETFEMWSIDIPDNAGYNPWTADGTHPPATGEILPNSGTNHLAYTGRFGGTSFACPVVAGVAALMLSINPNLTPQQIFNTLTSTANKVGGYTYTNGKCNQMGYGRVNAYAAAVAVAPTISGADFLCANSDATYTIPNKPSDATVTWTYSNLTLNSTNNTTGNSAVFHYNHVSNTSYLYTGPSGFPVEYVAGNPLDYYNAWIQATVNFGNGRSVTLPKKYIKEKGLVKGTYSQPLADNRRIFGGSNSYNVTSGNTINIGLFSDPSITYNWSIENLTKKVTPNNPDLSVSNNGHSGWFHHSYQNTYRLTISAVSCGTSHSETYEFYPTGGSSGGGSGGCMYSYNSGEETLDVSFEDGIATDIQLITTSKTKLSYTVQLYNFTGNLIKEGRSVGETVTWNLSSLPRGIYIISVKDSNNEIYNRKFLKN